MSFQRVGSAARQALPVLANGPANLAGAIRGAYIIAGADSADPDLLLIATGSEVSVAIDAQEILAGQGVTARVISLPSWEVFEEQPQDYKDQVMPPAVKARVSIEAGASLGWHKYVGDEGKVIAIDRFGASAPGEVVMTKFGFTPEAVAKQALSLVKRPSKVERGSIGHD